MSLFARLARYSLWLLMARVGAQICAVILTYLLARRLSVAEFGEYSFIAAAILIGNTLTTFGSDMFIIRGIAASSDFSHLPSALVLQAILSGLFIGFIFLFAPYLPNQTPESILALKVYSFALFPLAFFTVFTSALRGAQKMESYAWLNLLIAVLQVIFIAAFIRRGISIVALAYYLLAIQTVGTLVGGILCTIHFPSFWKDWHFSSAEISKLFIACLPIAIIATLGIVYQKMSLTMLALLGSASMAGWFSASARVIEAARMGHIAVFTALYPAMANARGTKVSSRIFKLSWTLLLIIAGGAAVLLFVLAKPIINIFFGLEYQSSVPVLKILSFTLIPYTVNSYLSLVFLVERQEKKLIRLLFVSLIVLILSNLWLIPRAHEAGAGSSFLFAETLQACLLLFEWKMNLSRSSQSFIPNQGAANELSDLS